MIARVYCLSEFLCFLDATATTPLCYTYTSFHLPFIFLFKKSGTTWTSRCLVPNRLRARGQGEMATILVLLVSGRLPKALLYHSGAWLSPTYWTRICRIGFVKLVCGYDLRLIFTCAPPDEEHQRPTPPLSK